MHPTLRLTVLGAAVLASACYRPEGAKAALTGHELFRSCSSCHGDQGQGNANLQAPAIAGLPSWYVEAQVSKFRTGARGAHPDDIEGLRMRPMSRQLLSGDEITTVAKYVEGLPTQKHDKLVAGGDAAAGQAAFATCIACHGPTAQGNKATNAPPLAGQSDWYLLAQLKKFKAGVRGTNPADATGASMRAMSMTLADEQAMKNVVAHISTLERQAAAK